MIALFWTLLVATQFGWLFYALHLRAKGQRLATASVLRRIEAYTDLCVCGPATRAQGVCECGAP